MGYAFISYSSKDKYSADAIREIFDKNGIETWMAPNDIPPGAEYAAVITDAIRNCDCLVLLLSNDSQSSKAVKREIDTACVRFQKSVISIQLEDLTLNDAFIFYIGLEQIIPIKKIDEGTQEIKDIIAAVAALTGKKDTSKDIPDKSKAISKPIPSESAESEKAYAAAQTDDDIDYGTDEKVLSFFAPDLRKETIPATSGFSIDALRAINDKIDPPAIFQDIANGKERLVFFNNKDIHEKINVMHWLDKAFASKKRNFFVANKGYQTVNSIDFNPRFCNCDCPLVFEYFDSVFFVPSRERNLEKIIEIAKKRYEEGKTTIFIAMKSDKYNCASSFALSFGDLANKFKIVETSDRY